MNDNPLPPPLTPELNPYAPPASPLSRPTFADALTGVVRDGKFLVVKRGHESQVPAGSCIKCGAPSAMTVKKGYYWHNPFLYALILVHIFIYLIVAVIVRKTMKIECGLCEQHSRRRKRLILGAWGSFAAAIISVIGAVSDSFSHPEILWIGLAVFLISSLVFAVLVTRAVLLPKKITSEFGCFIGAGEGYLAQLPFTEGASKF